MSRFTVAIAAVTVAGALVAPAGAARRPTAAEKTRLVSTVRLYVDTSACCAIMTRIAVTGAEVSTIDPRWAAVTIQGYDESHQAVGLVTATLHRGFLTNRWSVRAFGTSDLGCEAPAKVRRDLKLDCH